MEDGEMEDMQMDDVRCGRTCEVKEEWLSALIQHSDEL